jgi:hypothetical protein
MGHLNPGPWRVAGQSLQLKASHGLTFCISVTSSRAISAPLTDLDLSGNADVSPTATVQPRNGATDRFYRSRGA